MKFLFTLFLSTVIVLPIAAQQPQLPAFEKAPTQEGFLKNVGQVRDLQNKPVNFVYYQANIGNHQLFVTKYGLSILFARPLGMKKICNSYPGIKMPEKVAPSDSSAIVNYEMERIDISLKEAVISPANMVTKAIPQSAAYNLYCDNYTTAGEALRMQSEILIKEVYPGIDWKIYLKKDAGSKAFIKYDFIVHPGADPSIIKLKYSDNAKLELLSEELKAVSKMGEVNEEKPFSYLEENKSVVEVAYQVKKNTVSFVTANYNTHATLVIDPSIFWLTYLTSTNPTGLYMGVFGNDIATDAAGNIFVQQSASANTPFPTLNPGGGAYYQDASASPNGSMIMMKFTPSGQLLWSTYFGNGVGGRAMTIDKFGNICAVGFILDGTPSQPNTNPSIPLLNSGGFYKGVLNKYFITKFSNTGQLTWSSYYVNFSSYPIDMNYDINGNIYVVGWSEIHDFPVVDPGGGAYVVTNPQSAIGQVLFISQFNANDQLAWSTRMEGNSYDPNAWVCCDKLGNIYMVGNARSSTYPLLNAGGYFSNNDVSVITRFNSSRQITWSTRFPSAFGMSGLTTDNDNNLYIISDKRIVKFNTSTQKIFEISVHPTKMHFWGHIIYDPVHNHLQLLGVMNEFYFGFPTLNTACGGTFFDDGQPPQNSPNSTGPVFGTMTKEGVFSYLSLVDWGYEYYDYSSMSVDVNGDPVYLFGHNKNASITPNPQLTNPGNGAYFDPVCSLWGSSLLLKLTASESMNVTAQVTAGTGCDCNASATATVLCGTAPYTYLWSNASTSATATGLCPGSSWVKVTDANNISKVITVNIPYPPGSVTSIATAAIPENCNKANGSITVQSLQGGTAPFTYSLDGITYQVGTQFTNLTSGNHILFVKDAIGCVYKDTISITTIAGPSNASFNTSKQSCIANDGQVIVTGVQGGVGPYTYTLNGNTNTTGIFTNLAAATYQLQVADTAGCIIVKTVTVDKAIPPADAAYTTSSDHCNMSIGLIQPGAVNGGQSPYTFSVDSIVFLPGVINNLGAGNYNLFVRDANGCVLKKSPVVINNITGPSVDDLSIQHAYCGKITGGIIVNGVTGNAPPYIYAMDNSSYQATTSFNLLQPGNHQLYIKDNYGCIYTRVFEINFKPTPKLSLIPADTLVCYNAQVLLNLIGEVDLVKSVTWNFPNQGNSAIIKPSQQTNVVVNIIDKNNCSTTIASILKVIACNTPEKCIEIPNAFTPNKDGKNDLLRPLINGCKIESISFQIFNRYGQVIFETQKDGAGWDGYYKGLAQPGGAYTYLCTYIIDGNQLQKKGSFVLIR